MVFEENVFSEYLAIAAAFFSKGVTDNEMAFQVL